MLGHVGNPKILIKLLQPLDRLFKGSKKLAFFLHIFQVQFFLFLNKLFPFAALNLNAFLIKISELFLQNFTIMFLLDPFVGAH